MKFIPDFNRALSKEFFRQKTEIVAKELLGNVLVRRLNSTEILAARILETEAYLPEGDLSCHAAVGKTRRNAPMFEEGGILYIYKIYGIHHCINFVTEEASCGCAVLIRSLEPLLGIDIMQKFRGKSIIENLCKGPGNLARAFDFSITDNNHSLISEDLFVQKNSEINEKAIFVGKRIGIKKSSELPLRFFLANLSKK